MGIPGRTSILLASLLVSQLASAQITRLISTADPSYAESVMIAMLSDDGTEELSLRLARFPASGNGEVWLHIATRGGAWSLADNTFDLVGRPRTQVGANDATFAATTDVQSVSFLTSNRQDGLLRGQVLGSFLVAATRDPSFGVGSIPVTVDVTFNARSAGVRNGNNRWELVGRVSGTVTVANVVYRINHAGKWHEQTGPRANFAPAFTYFNVQDNEQALLAIKYRDRVSGYLLGAAGISDVVAFEIEPLGSNERAFTVTLGDGTTIDGVANITQHWSVPIEGKRRPGSGVVVQSNVGLLTGSLNDWQPD